MSEPLLLLIFAAAGGPIKLAPDMALEAVLEIISLQSECVRLRERLAASRSALELAAKTGNAQAVAYGALHERYRELADLLAPFLAEPPEETRLMQ